MANIYNSGRPSRQSPQNVPGEYRWRNKKTNEIDYVGETKDLKRRMLEHERSEKPVSCKTHYFEWKRADGRFSVDRRRDHETKKINILSMLL